MYARFMAIGRLTKDPGDGFRSVPIGGEEVSVCNFSIACDPERRDGDTDFYDCVAWRKLAENLNQYMSKGKLIYVEGRPHVKKWEKDGVQHSKTEYTIDTIKFLDRGEKAPAAPAGGGEDNPPF